MSVGFILPETHEGYERDLRGFARALLLGRLDCVDCVGKPDHTRAGASSIRLAYRAGGRDRVEALSGPEAAEAYPGDVFQRAFERYRALDPGADPRRSLDEEVARRAAGAMVPGVDNVVARGMEPDWAQGELDSLARRAKDTMGEDDYVAMVRFTNGMRRMIAELRRRFPDDADWDRGAVVAPSVAQAAVPVSAGAWACPSCGATGNTGRFCSSCGSLKTRE